MFTKISVLVPTRKRLPQLQRLVQSFDTLTTPGTAELVFRIDDDDPDSAAYLATTPWPVVLGARLHGYKSLPVFFEEMRAVATGDVYMCGNDDIECQTPGWAEKVLAVANQYPDGVFNLAVDTYNAGHVPWSIVSKRAAEAMGHIQDPRIYWADVYLRDVFAQLQRVVPVPVTIAHHWMGWTPDQVFRESQQDTHGAWTAEYTRVHHKAVEAAVVKLQPLLGAI